MNEEQVLIATVDKLTEEIGVLQVQADNAVEQIARLESIVEGLESENAMLILALRRAVEGKLEVHSFQ